MSEGMLAHAKELTAMRSEVLARDDVPAASYLGVLFDLYGMGAVVGAPSCWPTQAEFAERTGRSQSGVSKLLGRLVEEGAVERRRDRHRRRRARRPVPATHRSATGQQGRRSPPVSEKDGM
jgi:MarR family